MGTGTGETTRGTERPEKLHGKLWGASQTFLTETVKVWVVLIGAAVIAFGFWVVADRIKDTDARQRATDRQGALIAAFNAEQSAYNNSLNARTACLDSVEQSNLNRGQHLATVAAFESLLPGTPPAYRFAIEAVIDTLRAGPLLATPPRTMDECPPVPTAPVAPEV